MSKTLKQKGSKESPKVKCPQCQKNEARVDKTYGVVACDECQLSDFSPTPAKGHEFTSTRVKSDRKEYAKAMVQPWVDGVLSKEFVEAHGTSKLAGVTEKDIKNAKYVYKGKIPKHHRLQDSKI
jgi:hypothetical protein